MFAPLVAHMAVDWFGLRALVWQLSTFVFFFYVLRLYTETRRSPLNSPLLTLTMMDYVSISNMKLFSLDSIPLRGLWHI